MRYVLCVFKVRRLNVDRIVYVPTICVELKLLSWFISKSDLNYICWYS